MSMEITLSKKALLLSYFTVGYNLIEGVISISSGFLVGSTALLGFGIDSFVESLSGSVMIWRFRKADKLSKEESEEIERKALKILAFTFFILGVYIIYESGKTLLENELPEKSLIGIIITILSIIIMPTLAYLKYQTGKQLKSSSLIADSKQTLACIVLSITTLLGLGLNYLFGFWQADSIAGFIIGLYLFKEGYEAYKGEDE